MVELGDAMAKRGDPGPLIGKSCDLSGSMESTDEGVREDAKDGENESGGGSGASVVDNLLGFWGSGVARYREFADDLVDG